jgi:putative alpha-1,2-mannosidase
MDGRLCMMMKRKSRLTRATVVLAISAFAVGLSVVISAGPAAAATRLSDYVDTRRGSNSDGSYSRGNTFPGATVPNGFQLLDPDHQRQQR